MATLGIVEASIFFLHQYFEVDLTKEKIFADVHFTLFYVAIINAFMGCVAYALAMRVAERTWVKMEALDANHYLAIRTQFQLVKQELKKLEKSTRPEIYSTNHSLVSLIGPLLKSPAQILRLGQQSWVKGMLKEKYNELILQIKFHDLRVQFIEKNKLPSNFR